MATAIPKETPIKVIIKDGWEGAGKTGIQLASIVFCGQWWVPVLWDGEEDPTFHKLRGLIVAGTSYCQEKNGINVLGINPFKGIGPGYGPENLT